MPPEDIDDLFREKLDGHPTPPGDALWARLQASTPAENGPANPDERLDQLFQLALNDHATPPRRELWERLEDEHLRPTKPRPAAWWPMALAAAVALLLVAGGAGLWLGFPFRHTEVATRPARPKLASPSLSSRLNVPAVARGPVAEKPAENRAPEPSTVAATTAPQFKKTVPEASQQKKFIAEATRPLMVASTAPKARTSAHGQSPRQQMGTSRQPDAAATRSSLVADGTPRTPQPAAADEPRKTAETAPAVAAATQTRVLAPEIVPAGTVPATGLAGELITVDVRTGGNPVARPTKTVSTALAGLAEPAERRRLGGRLLQQAGNLVRGERVSLAEVTGLPENVTLRATIAGRSVTKSIQL